MMKRILSIALLIMATAHTTIIDAQSVSMSEFWDLNYHMTKDSVEAVVKAKKANNLLTSIFNKKQISVKNVVLHNEFFKYAMFDFYQNKLLSGYFTQIEKNNEAASILFLRLRESLTEKYGEPEIETSDIITCYWHDKKQHIVQLSMKKVGKNYHIGVLYLNGRLHSHKMIEDEKLKP